jgi:molecular chaperone HscB
MASPIPVKSHFETLGVPRRYHLAPDLLERQFHDLNRVHHPDRHAKADAATRTKNALATSQLNEAYRALKDPLKRAEYLLKVEGIEISDERSGHKVSPAFLAEIMELREQLMDARLEGDVEKVRVLADQVGDRKRSEMALIDSAFGRFEERGDREALKEVADHLIAERYFRRFLEEAEGFIEDHVARSP